MPTIKIYIDGDTEQPTPTPTPEPPADLQSEIDRINRALCDVLTRIAKIEGEVRSVRMRLLEGDVDGEVP